MINGIDVSHHNDINWASIRSLNLSQNLYFTFAKASEGTGNPDAKFDANRRGGASAGLLTGAYHFFLPTEDPVAQAVVLVGRVGALAPGELPPVVDIEWTKIVNKQGQVKRAELWSLVPRAKRIDVIRQFLDAVEQRLGVKPIIYTAVSFWKDFITKNNPPAAYAPFANHPLWIVNIKGSLTIPDPWGKATFVQNGFGELAPKGASAFEKLDHDFFNGSLFELLMLAAKGQVFARGKTPVSPVVRDFQQALKVKGFYSDILDGDFGKNSEKAVKDFQQSLSLPVTGSIDEVTWKMLLT
jgi:lysozyme